MADPAAELQRQLQLLAEQFSARLQRELPELSSQAAAHFVWTYLCGCIARGACRPA